MPVEVILRDFIKVSVCNPRDRTQALACNRIFMPKKMGFAAIFFTLCRRPVCARCRLPMANRLLGSMYKL